MYILYLQYMARCLLRFNINVGIKLLNQTRSLTTINTWEELTRAWSINTILELLFGGPEIFTMVETYLVSLCWISYCKCHGMVIYFHHNPGFQKENVQSVPIKIPSIRLFGKHFPSSNHPVCKHCVVCAYGINNAGKCKKQKHQTSVKNVMFLSAKTVLISYLYSEPKRK